MRKMQVLSVSLYDHTVRESMRKVEAYFRDARASTIACVSKRDIMQADENEQIREFFDKVDLMISLDSDILRAANVETRSRLREIDENVFLNEFLRRIVRQKKTLYLLTYTNAGLAQLEANLRSYQENLRVVGRFALESLEADEDFIVNEINMLQPQVLVSVLPSDREIEFYDANHMKLSVNIWLMFRDVMILQNKNKRLIQKISDLLARSIFNRRLSEYKTENEENEKEVGDNS